MMCGCKNRNFDYEIVNGVCGEYQAYGNEDVESYWHLGIFLEDSGVPSLSIYDNGAGNPGISGECTVFDEENICIKYDKDLFEELPSDKWKLDGDFLKLTYSCDEEGITLSNNGADVYFRNEACPDIVSVNWKTGGKHSTDDVEVGDGYLEINGWYYDPRAVDDKWCDVPTTFFLSDKCIYRNSDDDKTLSKSEFKKLLAGTASNLKLEFSVKEGEIIEVSIYRQ